MTKKKRINIVLMGDVPSWKAPIIDWKKAIKGCREPRAYNPEHKNKILFREQVKDQVPEGFVPWSGPITLHIVHIRPIPKYLEGKVSPGDPHLKRPDTTNITKFSEDCLSGIVFDDDSQVWYKQEIKIYGEEPRTEIEIEERE